MLGDARSDELQVMGDGGVRHLQEVGRLEAMDGGTAAGSNAELLATEHGQKLQEELQKRAAEARAKLEQQSGTAPATPPKQ